MKKEVINFLKRTRRARNTFKAPITPITLEHCPDTTYKGRVLLSYIPEPLLYKNDCSFFDGHSNKWESREIARIFTKLGYSVDAISCGYDKWLCPKEEYKIVFDIHANLQHLHSILPRKTKKILHLTGSYPKYQNNQELLRIKNLEFRRDIFCSPKRIVPYTELACRSIELADHCSLIGNEHTLKTYPKHLWDKITCVPVSASNCTVKAYKDLVPKKREFLWFFGSGMVHKGLDLVLESFSKNRNLVLNVVGYADREPDFFNSFRKELLETENINYHGFLNPSSDKFKNILKNVFCFIAPSCSEGISPACITCLQGGLFPIISKNTGISLPNKNCGIYLEANSVEEISEKINLAYKMNSEDLQRRISQCQNKAIKEYSRENFSKKMHQFLDKICQ
jgi:glycosyltransferase involved in cell wall biosynthesis